MCIRDSFQGKFAVVGGAVPWLLLNNEEMPHVGTLDVDLGFCLLYTSDAADERSSVDLGGRRIIKQKLTLAIRGV